MMTVGVTELGTSSVRGGGVGGHMLQPPTPPERLVHACPVGAAPPPGHVGLNPAQVPVDFPTSHLA